MDYKKIILQIVKNWKFICASILFLFVVNLFFIKRNLIFFDDKKTESPVLKSYKVTGNCFYQLKDSSKWLFLSSEELIFPGTSIQSDENAHLILTFLNQSGKIEISEKTYVKIYENKKDIFVDFMGGEIFINYQFAGTQKPIYVRVGDRVFQFTNADLYLNGEAGANVQVGVDYGRVTMEHEGLTNTFEKGQSVLLKKGREFSVTDSKFVIATPLNYDRFSLDFGDTVDVRFAFAELDKPYYVQLYLGESPSSVRAYLDKTVSSKDLEFSVELPKGSYYWQLAALEKTNGNPISFSPIKRFFIEPKISIQPVEPLANESISLQNGRADVRFRWDNPSQLERVYFEISDQKDFSNLIAHENITQNNYFNYSFEKTGTFFWRVSGFPFGTSDLLTGPSRKINITSESSDTKINIIFPKGEVTLTSRSVESSDISFQWSALSSIEKYRVVLNHEKTKKKYSFIADSGNLKVTDIPSGKYTWHVESASDSGMRSETQKFTILAAKKIEFFNAKTKKEGTLSWEKGPKGTALYRVEVMKIGSRSNFNEFFNPKSSFKSNMEVKKEEVSYKNFSEGVYAFKVYALDKQKKILADTSLRFLKVDTKQ